MELRVYLFADETLSLPEDRRWFAEARTWQGGKEQEGWAFIKQDSVPVEVIRIAEAVGVKILAEMKVKFGVIGIDFIKAEISGERGSHYLIREINTKPAMSQPNQNYNSALEQRRRLALLIAKAARSVLG